MIKPGSSPLLKKPYGSRWALLVGVNDYADDAISDLKVCAGDVQAVYDLLTVNGYEPDRVRLLLSPGEPNPPATRVDIFAALNSVAQAAGENDLLLFYFSGHGITRDGQAYLLPADTSYAAIADTAVNLNRVKQIIQESAARAKVIILDACHSGAQIGKAAAGMTEEFVHHVFEEAEGLAILASCKQKQVSWEWPEKRQSVFTYYLLEGLRGAADFDEKGFVTVGDINRYVTDRVKTWAVQRSRVQKPTLQYTVAGDVILVVHSLVVNITPPATTLITTSEPKLDTMEFKDVGETSMKQSEEVSMHGANSKSTITWLHLSDFHFRSSETYDSNIVLKALLRDVAERIRDDHLRPDFIIVCGDIAFASRPEEYALAKQFFDDLLKTTGLSKDCLFLVPGNHDVDRNSVSTLAAGATAILNNRDAVNRFLSNDADRALVFQRFHNYQEFVHKYLGKRRLPFDDAHYFYVKHVKVAGQHVVILGLNSSWLAASDEDRNHLLLGEQQVRAALDAAQNANLCLAVMHHPFEWLQDFDRGDAEPLLCDGCDFVLHGHMHQVGLLQAQAPDSQTMLIAAGACYETRKYPNSYNFVQLDLGACNGTVHLRMYSDQRGGFWTKDVVNYRHVEDGEYSFSLPNRLCSQIKSESNLFIYGRPVCPDEFVDREPELRTIFNRLRNGESTAITGEPHIGKSSLLLKLADQHTQQAYLEDAAQSLLITYRDLHPIEDGYTTRAFWEDALEPLWEHADQWATLRHFREITRADYTHRSLERLFNYLGKSGRRLVLLLDEFERLLVHPNFQSPSFFALLRSLASRTGGLVLVTASRQSVAEMNAQSRRFLETGSPFFNIMIDMRLRPFDERAIDNLLNWAGDAFSFQDRLFIRRVAGRHPFLLQAMAATLLETSGEDRYSYAAEHFYDRVALHFDDSWNGMDNHTRTAAVILSLVEMGGRILGQAFSSGEIGQVDQFGPELSEMAKRGLAERVGEEWQFDRESLLLWQGERWTVGSQAFAWWVRDVVIAEFRPVSAYSEWLANKQYRSLLTEGQWERLVNVARSTPEWAARGIRTLAKTLVEELVRSKE